MEKTTIEERDEGRWRMIEKILKNQKLQMMMNDGVAKCFFFS